MTGTAAALIRHGRQLVLRLDHRSRRSPVLFALTAVGAALLVTSCSASSAAPDADDGETAITTTVMPTIVTEPPPGVDAATDEPTQNAGGTVEPIIAAAGWFPDEDTVEVSGYVPGVVEDGGVCSVIATRGEQRVQKDGPATADASTTTCGTISVPGDQLSQGTWDIRLLYSSPSSTGTSSPTAVEVPR